MFKCVNLDFSGCWLFRVGREYELFDDKRHPGYYTFKLSVDNGEKHICNAPKECFEEVTNKSKNSLIMEANSKIELIEPNYEGIAKVLSEFEKLYKVCDNTELLDRCLEHVCKVNAIVGRP